MSDQMYVVTRLVTARTQNKDDVVGGQQGYVVIEANGDQAWMNRAEFEATHLCIGDIAGLEPHHQRMLAERVQLCDRITKLVTFIGTNKFLDIEPLEQVRLHSQLDYMMCYRRELDERLIALNEAREVTTPVS